MTAEEEEEVEEVEGGQAAQETAGPAKKQKQWSKQEASGGLTVAPA